MSNKILPEDKIIEERIKKLKEYIKDKKLYEFYHFVDDHATLSSANIHPYSFLTEMKKNPEKYVGKRIAQVFIVIKLKNLHKPGILDDILVIKIVILEMLSNGTLSDKQNSAMALTFNTEDFKKIKFSFKLLKNFMNAVKDKIIKTNQIGQNFNSVIEKLKKNKIDTAPFLR